MIPFAFAYQSSFSPFAETTLVALLILTALIVFEVIVINMPPEKKILQTFKFLTITNLVAGSLPIAFIYIIRGMKIPQAEFNENLVIFLCFALPLVLTGLEFFIYHEKYRKMRKTKLLGLLLFINLTSYFIILFLLVSQSISMRGYRRSPRMACTSNLKQIGLSLKQYAMDYDDWFPDKSGPVGFEKLRSNDYLTDYRVYRCPSCKAPRGEGKQKLNNKIVDYVYRSGLRDNDDFDKSKTPLAWDRPTNHEDFGNVLFLDGHVKGFKGADWMAQAGIKKIATQQRK